MSRLIPSLLVGLLVNFVLPADCTHAGEIRPAVITRVNSTIEPHINCNLAVLRDGPNDPDVLPWYGSVHLDQVGKSFGTFHRVADDLVADLQPATSEFPAVNIGGKRASADAIAKAAYDAYCADAGGVSLVSGQPLPKWVALTLPIQHAWVAASEAALNAEWIDHELVDAVQLTITHAADLKVEFKPDAAAALAALASTPAPTAPVAASLPAAAPVVSTPAPTAPVATTTTDTPPASTAPASPTPITA